MWLSFELVVMMMMCSLDVVLVMEVMLCGCVFGGFVSCWIVVCLLVVSLVMGDLVVVFVMEEVFVGWLE